MKKYGLVSLLILALSVLCTGLFSFTANKGGDVFEIYLNGRQVLRQLVYADKSVKTLQLHAFDENDKIEVMYSHCGASGKNRLLTLRNDKNELIKEFQFPDADNNRSMMGFYLRDISKAIKSKLRVYYSSKEIPDSKLLAIIDCSGQQVTAKP